MEIIQIYYSTHFQRVFKSLPMNVKRRAIEKEKIFQADCFDPRLKTHKFKGKLKECWSFSIDESVRILFKFYGKGVTGFIDIGSHDIYKMY
jgi:mRNA-degrading endonuclease YafQ of YafQ-DinJ toxin-antitoxin module